MAFRPDRALDDNAQDLQDLRQLLSKHNVPKGVTIRLIHKHFDTIEGEVMIFDNVSVPGHGIVKIMKPVSPGDNNRLRGIHYFVNDNATLQADEYGTYEVPDLSGYQPFLAEFWSLVTKRGLQHKFGLKLQCEDDADQTGWTEYELHAKRGTIMFPDGMPMPDGDSDYSVTTEWKPIVNQLTRTCKHTTTCAHGRTTCKHCKHCNRHDNENADFADLASELGFCLGGQRILPGTPVHDVVNQIITAF